jgi:hypothetical protein
MPSNRRCRLRTITGSKLPSRSRGTSICTGPTARANQVDSFDPGSLHQLLGELLRIDLLRHGRDRLGHDWSFPPSKLGVSEPVTPFL